MRVEENIFNSSQLKLEKENNNRPEFVERINELGISAFNDTGEKPILCNGRVEIEGGVDSDGKGHVNGRIVLEFV